MKRLASVIVALLLLPAASHSGDLSLGFGYPYVSVKYDLSAVSLEGRFATGSGVNVYSGRSYWNFHRTDSLTGFAGLEGGYINFNALGMKGTGYEGSLFVGGQYRLTGDFYLLMDFAPTLILLRHDVYTDVEVAGVEYVVNAAVYYRFGGSRTGAPGDRLRKPSRQEGEETWLKELASPDWEVRKKAAFALGKNRSPAAVEPLIDRLTDDNDKVRGTAALALGRIGSVSALGSLVNKLHDPVPYVRTCAVKGLLGLKDVRALVWLEFLLKDGDKEVRAAAKAAIEKLKSKD